MTSYVPEYEYGEVIPGVVCAVCGEEVVHTEDGSYCDWCGKHVAVRQDQEFWDSMIQDDND